MKVSRMLAGASLLAVAAVGGLAYTGHLPLPKKDAAPISTASIDKMAPPIAVTAAKVKPATFVASVVVTGSLVPREEILVGPEIEGLRIVEVLADEGDRVRKGQVLAKLVSTTLDAQFAQNEAGLARADASIAQAKSNIASAEARLVEARNSYDRGRPLAKSGYISESGMDQREATAKTAEAALAAAKDALRVAEAERAQIEAQKREIVWRRSRTDIMAPADGLVSRRMARIGAYASGASDSLFRIIANSEVELDAEVAETHLAQISVGQPVEVSVAGAPVATGKVRLISPEVDKATRLGRVRVFLGDDPRLHIGSFARGVVETKTSHGLAVPAAAVLYGSEGATVQVVDGGVVRTRKVKLGLEQNGMIEVSEGLNAGEIVVARSGTFLRDGDAVRAVLRQGPQPQQLGSAG